MPEIIVVITATDVLRAISDSPDGPHIVAEVPKGAKVMLERDFYSKLLGVAPPQRTAGAALAGTRAPWPAVKVLQCPKVQPGSPERARLFKDGSEVCLFTGDGATRRAQEAAYRINPAYDGAVEWEQS